MISKNTMNNNSSLYITCLKKGRVHWVDVAKGILILLLLEHHFISAMRVLDIDDKPYGFVYCWNIIFSSFFMQGFFFLSGYCSNFLKPKKDFFIGVFTQLIVPFVCFEIIICLYWAKSFSLLDIYDFWLQSKGTSLWFLNALIVSKVFIWCFIRCIKSELSLFLLSLLILVGAIALNQYRVVGNFLFIKNALGSIFFVAVGYICKKDSILKKFRILGGGFPYILLLLLLFDKPIPSFTAWIGVSLCKLPVFLITSLSGTMALINVCKMIQKNEILEFFGKNTLIVYCSHFIPLTLILSFCVKVVDPISLTERISIIIFTYLMEIFVMVVLIELFKFKPFKWLLGKF